MLLVEPLENTKEELSVVAHTINSSIDRRTMVQGSPTIKLDSVSKITKAKKCVWCGPSGRVSS
jgi:hypothetical protein